VYEGRGLTDKELEALHKRASRIVGDAPNLNFFYLNAVVSGYLKDYAVLKGGKINLYDLHVINELITYKSNFEETIYVLRKNK